MAASAERDCMTSPQREASHPLHPLEEVSRCSLPPLRGPRAGRGVRLALLER